MKKSKITFKRGFTLIELLVVISIIAVLMSIMMPALAKVREQGRQTVCSANHRTFVQYLSIYAESNKGNMPVPFSSWSDENKPTVPASYWYYYMKSTNLIGTTSPGDDPGGNEKKFWSCPSVKAKEENPQSLSTKLGNGLSIGMNDGWTNLDDASLRPTNNVPVEFFQKGININRVKDMQNTVVTADVRASWAVYTWRWASLTGGSWITRHGGGKTCMFGFLDGHTTTSEAQDDRQARQNICVPAKFKYDYNNLPY